MGDLKDIWNNSSVSTTNRDLIDMDVVSEISQQLLKEQRIQEKYKPYLRPYVLLIGSLLLFACFSSSKELNTSQIIGVLIITFGGMIFMNFLSRSKWFEEKGDYSLSPIEFFKNATSSLLSKRKEQKRAIYILHITLTLGLHLMIFGISLEEQQLIILVAYYFFMLVFALLTVNKTMSNFDLHYRFISSRYESLLEDIEQDKS